MYKDQNKKIVFSTHLTIWEHEDTSKQHNINLYLYPEQEMGECKAHVVSKSKHTKKLQQKHFQTLLWQPKKKSVCWKVNCFIPEQEVQTDLWKVPTVLTK